MFGGELGGGVKANDLWHLDLESMTWHKFTLSGAPPSPRSGASLILLGSTSRALVFGGTSPIGSNDDTVYVAQLGHHGSSVGWKALTRLETAFTNHEGWLDVSSPVFERRPEIFTPWASSEAQWDTAAT